MIITDRINEELNRYKTTGYPAPDCIYLGAQEFGELRRIASQFCVVDVLTHRRLTFQGLGVYLVDELYYIGFGVNQPSPCG